MSQQTDFIKSIAPYAVETMKEYNILASLTIAQACLESNYGRSDLSAKYHNYFGVKGSGDGGSVDMATTEYKNGEPMRVMAAFAIYKTPKGSFDRRAQLFHNGTSWNPNLYRNLIGVTDYRTACRLVQKDGYATDPAYADKLISIIETFHINQYDNREHAPYYVIIPNLAFWQAEGLVTEFEHRGYTCEGQAFKSYGPNDRPQEGDPYQFVITTYHEEAVYLVIELKTRGYDRTYGEAIQ